MKLAEDHNTQKYRIRAYSSDHIQINEEEFTESIILSANHLSVKWPIQKVSNLSEESLEPILSLQPELVILGSGKDHVFPEPNIDVLFAKANIGFEVMTTLAACRTYNLLANDDRKVVAALILNAR